MATVVVIEDDTLLRRMYEFKFKQAGYDLHIFSNGAAGLKGIKKHKPTVVLSDIMVPKMSGLEVLTAMKEDEELKRIPYVFLTNVARTDEDIRRGLELGAVGYLIKSDLTPDEIVVKVKEIIEAHASTEELPEIAEEKLERIKKGKKKKK
jgi:DNA-binding response OmpR family regulator